MTTHEIMTTLLTDSDVDARVTVLTQLVLDLFVEVEALRRALDSGPEPGGVHPGLEGIAAQKTAYQQAYLNAVYTSHNSAGPSTGLQKILSGFYPEASSKRREDWRECAVLRRLGFTPEEVTQYVEAAREAETYT